MPVQNVRQMRKDVGLGEILAATNANLVFECTNLIDTSRGNCYINHSLRVSPTLDIGCPFYFLTRVADFI